jgi:eukaryotic-like serine/threonine-protein kinase
MSIPRTAAELFQTISMSELIEADRLTVYCDGLRASQINPADAMECAQLLVCDGLLTQFQAKLLLQGKWKNFFLGGKYKVLDQLGSGGMGTVYLCEHRYMRRRVAIKILPPEKGHSPLILQRFMREAQAVARLDHPNIVRAHDIGQHGELFFLVLEYIEGINLHQLVQDHGRLTIARAVNYTVQSALGLHHAHSHALIHRDVKPANLLLDRNGFVKLLDLGLARFSDDRNAADSQSQGGVLGTADYIAPEQALDAEAADARADIYSLGCTLYYMLSGHPVFDGGTVSQKLIKHQTASPTPITAVRPETPRGLADILCRMLSKDPMSRPQTCNEVMKLLQPWYTQVSPPSPEELPPSQYARCDTGGRTMSGSMTLSGKTPVMMLKKRA